MKKIVFCLCVAAIASGCGMKGKVSDKSINDIMDCTDTRDGEKFSFKASSAKNIIVGTYGVTMDIVTLDGKEKHLTSDMEKFIKCDKRKQGEL